MTKPQLLLVDDDRHVLDSMSDWLRSQGYDLDASPGYADALERLRQKSFDLVLADVRLRDGDGFDLLEQCRRNWPASQVVLMTGYGSPDGAIEAIRAGAFDYVTKPLIDNELLMTIERAMSQRSVKQENDNLRQQLDRKYGMDNIVGRDPRMLKVFEMIGSVADTRATVLVTGESGTGKSMIARAIHRRSGRAKGPFVEVACGALPETLLESELFGHVAGAFTGATGEKMGKFLQAHGGTIFLDEIGTASPAMQVKLLRVLQELKFEQVGGTKTFDVDVRVVLATNEDLSRAVSEGRFRQDLYYRVNVINIELPPLRSRPSDISTLAHSFLEQVREDSRRQVTGFADDALVTLERYNWPGNVRELQNVMERAVLLGKGPIITVADLPTEVRGTGAVIMSSPAGTRTLKEALEGPERQIIREVLESNGWNRNLTADQLGINRTTLYKKMKRLGLEDGRVGVM
ncbi:MAG TPA: sigma-54 dependent transcriptional regulator [Lacipirellulaceae bacterium]|jgi:DNA-binding NtrC family response regulator|nr:sigma-54 dependent transcriptional regulator [Lacipirellulaceae bacterium]